jgi:hypothetical protein
MQHHVEIRRGGRKTIFRKPSGDDDPATSLIRLVDRNEVVDHLADGIPVPQQGKPHHFRAVHEPVQMIFKEYGQALKYSEVVKHRICPQQAEIRQWNQRLLLRKDLAIDILMSEWHDAKVGVRIFS